MVEEIFGIFFLDGFIFCMVASGHCAFALLGSGHLEHLHWVLWFLPGFFCRSCFAWFCAGFFICPRYNCHLLQVCVWIWLAGQLVRFNLMKTLMTEFLTRCIALWWRVWCVVGWWCDVGDVIIRVVCGVEWWSRVASQGATNSIPRLITRK